MSHLPVVVAQTCPGWIGPFGGPPGAFAEGARRA